MRRVLAATALWLWLAAGGLGTLFFTTMLLTPGYADGFTGFCAAFMAALTASAGVLIRWRAHEARSTRATAAAEILRGELLLELVPSRRRWTITTLAAGALLAASLFIVISDALPALLLVALFATLFAASAVQLIPGASWLRVTSQGFVTRHVGRIRAHHFATISQFRVFEVSSRYTTQRLVGWTLREGAESRRVLGWLRRLQGVDDSLPTEYEGDTDELAATLQRYRDTLLAATPQVRDPYPTRPRALPQTRADAR